MELQTVEYEDFGIFCFFPCMRAEEPAAIEKLKKLRVIK